MSFYNKAHQIKRYAPILPGVTAPSTFHDENPVVCVAINETWIPLILGALQIFIHDDLLAGTPEDIDHASQEVVSLMVAIAEGNIPCTGVLDMPYLLRQKPGYPCLLEQSLDNGLIWTLAFDFTLCKTALAPPSAGMNDLNVITFNTNFINIQLIYNGNPESVAPDMVYDDSPDDDIRDAAMCYAINVFVATLAAQYEDKINKGYDWKDYAEIGATIVALGAASIFVVSTFPATVISAKVLVATGIAAEVATFVLSVLPLLPEGDDYTPILESEIQRYITCVASEALAGSIPDSVAFESMWDELSTEIVGADLKALLQGIAESEKLYLQFLDIIQRAFVALSDGQEFTCSCDEYTWTMDFTQESGSAPFTSYGQGAWEVLENEAGQGGFVPGEGFTFTDESPITFIRHRGTEPRLPNVVGQITSVMIEFDRVAGVAEMGDTTFASIRYGGDAKLWKYSELGEGEGLHILRNAARPVNGEAFQMNVRSDERTLTTPPYTGSGVLKKVVVTGFGSVPNAFVY